MVQAPQAERTVLRSREATVVVQYVDLDHARLEVDTQRYGPGAREAARLVCEAVYQARARHVHHVETALDAAAPACCIILEALRNRSGNDLEGMELRRAGASVMVSLDVRPWPSAPFEPAAERVDVVPTAPEHRGRRRAVGSSAGRN
jgi:hypothetical protein